MFFGHINQLANAEALYPAPIVKALRHLQATDFSKLDAGQYEIDGRDIYMQVIDTATKDKSQTKPEVHKNYIDVQFLVSGQELMGFASDTGNNSEVEAHPDRDLYFYADAENEIDLRFRAGNFAVYFPFDVHRPCCADGEPMPIRKVVIKVAMHLLS